MMVVVWWGNSWARLEASEVRFLQIDHDRTDNATLLAMLEREYKQAIVFSFSSTLK